MQQNYQDAMAIVRKYGKPDLFITFTCNPNWPEITENLPQGVPSSDRPELVARVFNLKLQELMQNIEREQVFGKIEAYVYVVEFQKRGLPHAHILVVLQEVYKLREAEDVDRFVRAEIPNPDHSLPTKTMDYPSNYGVSSFLCGWPSQSPSTNRTVKLLIGLA